MNTIPQETDGKHVLRVLQLGKFYPILGGVEKVMFDLLTGFSKRTELRVACDMMCATTEGGDCTILVNGSAKLFCCKAWKKVKATMLSASLVRTLRRECGKYDIIHVHHPDPMACLALFLSGYKGKVVLHWHSDILKQRVLLRFYMPLQSWLLRRADVVVGTSPVYIAESPYLKSVQHKAVCLPIGVEPMMPRPQAVRKIREAYLGKKIVFSLGRLVGYKGYRYLIEAAQYLGDDYVVLIGGTGVLEASLRQEIARCGVEAKVVLLGRVSDEDLPAYYGACDVFCLSSIYKTEAFGVVQIEAMSCGKPVVATNIPQSGVSWCNAHGVSGLNVPPANAEELANAIVQLTCDREVYAAYAKRARQRYEQVFTKDLMISNCKEIYFKLWKR